VPCIFKARGFAIPSTSLKDDDGGEGLKYLDIAEGETAKTVPASVVSQRLKIRSQTALSPIL
jgi:hypothetical protein